MQPSSNNNNSISDTVTVFMLLEIVNMARPLQRCTWFICWMHTDHQVAANPAPTPTELGCESTGSLLQDPTAYTKIQQRTPLPFIVIAQHESCYSFTISHGGWKAELTLALQ